MQGPSTAIAMIALNLIMITYTLWCVTTSRARPPARHVVAMGCVLVAWLGALHLGLSNEAIFPHAIGGAAFLAITFAAVGAVGALLFIPPAVRAIVLGLDQPQLQLLQGIRVFYGAMFLAQAGMGVLPLGFGILDGFTHVAAGFFGLVAAFSLSSGADGPRRAWFANVFGLADILLVASSIALVLLRDIGPHHAMMYAVFLPAPLWFWFHVVSILKLVKRI
jgi:hypothetical protein